MQSLAVAVMLRLASAHHVTEDLDTVAWTPDGTSDAPIRILMQRGATRSHNVAARATTQVAGCAALVAMKLGAVQQRRGTSLHKRSSDVYDIYRLLAEHDRDGQVATELASAPDGLGPWCARKAREIFDVDAEQTKRWLNNGSPDMASIATEQLRTVGTLFSESLDHQTDRGF